jgi:hypothetical protein
MKEVAMEYFEQGVKKQKNFTMYCFCNCFGALALISVVFQCD